MSKDIEIELSHGDDKKLSAFNIYYASRDPKMAQAATAELANLFITENLEQRQERSENTTKFLEDQLDQARTKLSKRKKRNCAFKDQHLGELPTQTAEQPSDFDRPAESGAGERRLARPRQTAKCVSGVADQSISRHGHQWSKSKPG
jgi:hypothetical protein